MKKLLFFILSLICFASFSQSNFQRQLFHSAPAGNLWEVIYSNEYNTSTFVIKNLTNAAQYAGFAELTKFTTTTGNVSSSKTFSVAGYDLSIKDVVKNNQMLYITASISNSLNTIPLVIKYNLSTNATVWRKTLTTNIYPYNAITFDSAKNIYLLGSYQNSLTLMTDLTIAKLDTNGVLLWTKGIMATALDHNPGDIVFNGNRQLYVTAAADITGASKAVVIRLDSSGAVLNSKIISSATNPKFEMSFAGIIKGRLVAVDRTINASTFDPGPILIRILDTNLVAVKSRTITAGLRISGVSGNSVNLLVSGATASVTGYKGFRTMRFDSLLNISGRNFHKIKTVPVGGTSTGFINSSNNSFHFFTTFSNDTVYVAKTDFFESTGCRDTAYIPLNAILNYTATAYSYSSNSLAVTASNIVVPVGNATYSSASLCTAVTTGIESSGKINHVFIYPNPAASTLSFSDSEKLFSRYVISDVTGKSLTDNLFSNVVDVSALSPGLYFISLFDEAGKAIVTKKFVKE